MSKTIRVFSGATGLNTRVDPVRLPFAPETGVSDLSVAVNVKIDSSKRVSRRDGFALKQSGNFHSLFCDGGACLVCRDTSLFQVGSDYSLYGVRSGMTGERVSFCQILQDTFYSNGVEFGKVLGGTSFVWGKGVYNGPETHREFSGPFAGNHLAWYDSRMFISEGAVLWWSEPFAYGLYNKAKCFWQFDSKIRLVKPVRDGVFVSTETRTVFLRGQANDLKLELVAMYPAHEWSDAIDYVDGFEIGLQEGGLCALWASQEGAVLGTASGKLINLTRKKVIYPEVGSKGAGLLRGYNFVHTIW